MRSKKLIMIVAFLALMAAFAAAAVYLWAPAPKAGNTEQPKTPKKLSVGDPAPDFSTDILGGDRFALSDHSGNVVFLNFWASWCGPCVDEMPAIQELSELYTDVIFIGVNVAETQEKVRDFITKNGYGYNIGIDETGGILNNLYPSDGIPYTLIIDAEGIISRIFLGGGKQMFGIFEEAIREVLDIAR